MVLAVTTPALAGTYELVPFYVRLGDPTLPSSFRPFAIVHPPGYTGQSGVGQVDLFTLPLARTLSVRLNVDW